MKHKGFKIMTSKFNFYCLICFTLLISLASSAMASNDSPLIINGVNINSMAKSAHSGSAATNAPTNISPARITPTQTLIAQQPAFVPESAVPSSIPTTNNEPQMNHALASAYDTSSRHAGAGAAIRDKATAAAASNAGSKSGGGLGGLLSGVTKGASGLSNMLSGARNFASFTGQGKLLDGINRAGSLVQTGGNIASGIQGGAVGRLTGDLKNAGTRFLNTTQAVGIQPLGIFRPNATQTAQGRNSLFGGDMGTMRNTSFQINQASAQVNQYRPSEIRSTPLITAANGGTSVTRNNDGSIRINGGSLPVVNAPPVRFGP